MKIIKADFSGDESKFDFDGFKDNDCSQEEKALRVFLTRLGVATDGTEETFKRDRIPVPNNPIKLQG